MQSISIIREIEVKKTARLLQLFGVFDLSPSEKSIEKWDVSLSIPDKWNVGLIVGPSGSGKTTVAREFFLDNIISGFEWDNSVCVVDNFSSSLSIKEITSALSSVGFSSPPSWIKPFNVLSNGEKFRVTIARALTEYDFFVVDEFTSVVDRTIAQLGSSAIQKSVRRNDKKFIAVSCHYDIIEWLEPDWIYEPHTGDFFSGRYLHQRPKINIEIKRVDKSAWKMFRKYHYLDTTLHKAARCYVAFYNDIPVAFSSVLPFPHPILKNVWREHRTVCLPDYQGVGIGNALSDYTANIVKTLGFRYQSSTSNPAMIYTRNKSKDWKMIRKPSFSKTGRKTGQIGGSKLTLQSVPWKGVSNRLTSSFEYVGKAKIDIDLARELFYTK